ncbi:MAG: hypothetical protein KAX38_05885, partial [Candidatus Krumholzibacteria bacterium]|nr:hypothetical protein [Candidatus Krumholzibacteria bacterium]
MVKKLLKSKIMPWVSLMVGLLLTVFIIIILILHTDFFAFVTGRTFSSYFFSGTRFSLRVDKIGGNPLKNLKIEGLKIRYNGDDFSFDVLRVDEIQIKYNILSVIKKESHLDRLVIVNPHLWIKPDSTGTSILPSTGGGLGGMAPEFTIDDLVVQGGQVILQGDERADAIRNISMRGSLHSLGNEIYLAIVEGMGENLNRDIFLVGLNGDIRWITDSALKKGRFNDGGLLILDELNVELSESAMILNGTIDPDSLAFYLKVEAEPLEIEEITRVMNIETSHYGELQGKFIMKGVPDNVNIKGIFNGTFSGYAMDGFNVDITWNKSRIKINNCRGKFNGAVVDGKGFYTFDRTGILDLDLDAREVNLAEGFIPGRDMPRTMLNGRIKLTYHLQDEHLIFSLDLDEGHIRDFPFDQATLNGEYMNDTLYFDRILMFHPSHTVSSHGQIIGDEEITFF